MDLGKSIRYFRIKNDMTLTALSSETGLSVSYLSFLERNKRDLNIRNIESITKALGITPFLLVAHAEILDCALERSIGIELSEKIAKQIYDSHKPH